MDNLKSLREKAGYKQYDVAKVLNVTQGVISQWELGLCKPSYKYLSDLSKLYKCSTGELIDAINETYKNNTA